MKAEGTLIEQFVASFEKFDDLVAFEGTGPAAAQLAVGRPDAYGFRKWKARAVRTDPSLLEPLYAKLPARFPPLYEQLVLSYRWAEVDLGSFRLLANPLGSDLTGLLAEVEKDEGLRESLIPAGFIKFGKGPDLDYDPVCFDIKSRTERKDYRIVKVDHEEILCHHRVKVVAEIAPSFEQLVLQIIERADSTGR